MTDQPTFHLTLKAIKGGDIPPVKRLASLLKFALRSCGLRCVECRENKRREDIGNEDGERGGLADDGSAGD